MEKMTWELRLTTKEKENLVKVQELRKAIRNFLERQGFLEVNIPVIFPSKSLLYGGIPISGQIINGYLCAVMTPFIRRWLVLGKELNLSRVYFIGECFRDEEVDQDHYPVFENLAMGVRYEDYRFLMKLIQEMVLDVLKTAGQKDIGEWQCIPYFQLGSKTDFANIRTNNEKTLKEYSELTAVLSRPTFVTELPMQLFGPARKISQYTKERAELFIRGIEIGNISTFLTDAEELLQWYQEQDIDFSQYLLEKEHLDSVSTLNGELVTTGAIGLSRLYMVLLGLNTIKETVPFPYFGGD
ncbi:hypothetical protein CO121_00075 [bacterium (Candidatus Gribaldobacteria) CG_4_9_14_3_um_filter_36_15]|uniref:Aminoacyl-transfer RNA synthetases class-II family profile domain-containing protein n=4 Tax=Candidatus Gribaldobacteria TaxID=2798536 RepID=A0A2M7VKI3_9BACT|nr:MAG: hypothetical protein AUK07_00350 [Parcubacteria group bacterium CG2_30_36_21]PIR90989.1 MAG: hypothetical protein COU02_01465 [bacterium (Candidatus Gribaldobacteria) CG10_big_fil_rev_8_21_14_0_10_37_46]PIV13982.1 MAG: hypothetical protein COS44_01420 [bacterium (Candidatus Gribaldobacteria) CG03_land_8_20_14_0_80_36_40]PJA02350.1 MAG: hypothetical protein COX73_01245 [bacterium (Candidatus Gribaldobacteria) CG_4_10_14_0_2_um_filter_36_18]PJB09408.1 MAG: hypothetical protein CO121_00075